MERFLTLCFIIILTSLPLQGFAKTEYDIKGVDEQFVTDNVSVFLKGLTPPENPNNEAFLSQVVQQSESSLEALGYYQADIQTSVEKYEDDYIVSVLINLGERTKITEINLILTGEALHDPNFQQFFVNFPLKEGQFLNHSEYEAAKKRFKTLSMRYGYFDGKYITSNVQVTEQQNSAIVNLSFDSGIRYQFGDLIFDNDIPANAWVKSLMNFKPGDPFDNNVLNDFNQDLNETGYYRSITLLPAVNEKQGRLIPIHVISYMRPEDSFNAGLGYSTDEGVRGKFRWTRPWINKYGHSIETNIIASFEKQEISSTYKIPIKDPIYNYFSIQAGYKMLDQNDTDTKQYILGFNRHHKLSNDWLRTLYIRYDREYGTQGVQSFDTELILPGISFSRTESVGGINIDHGYKLLTYFEFAREALFSSDDVIKIYAQGKTIQSYKGHQFIIAGEAGAISADSIYDVPSSMRFFTGGDQSVRGYGYEEVAPIDESGYLVGGLYLTTASFEYRFPISENWKLAMFSDMGTATDDFSEPISYSAGSGVVWASPVGPVRLYVAIPLTETDDDYKIHFMIGPEL